MRRINKLGGRWPGARRAVKRIGLLLPVVLVGAVATLAYPWVFPQVSYAGGRGDPKRVMVRVLQHRIEQFRIDSADRQYPDLVGAGWDTMIDPNGDGDLSDGYIKTAPKNPFNAQTTVAATAAAGTGWHYDRATGVLGACYFDEETSTFTETP
jgi:hypothetical protein